MKLISNSVASDVISTSLTIILYYCGLVGVRNTCAGTSACGD
jgi:hypothetical protein